MRTRKRYIVLLGLAAAGVLAVASVTMAATTSTFTFNLSPSAAPKTDFAAASLATDLETTYTNPGNNVPGGAIERTQIFLDKNFKINSSGLQQCSPTQLTNQTMKGAVAACGNAQVGNGIATATANGSFTINGCVLLFNGAPQGGNPTLQVFTRVQASNPSTISCGNPSSNTQGNLTILLTGVLKPASSPYGTVLDVDHITQSASFPLEVFKTTIKKGDYVSARCNASDKTWRMQTTWTYNNNAKFTSKQTQPCTVKEPPPPPPPPGTKITKSTIDQKKDKATFKFKGTGDFTGLQCKLAGKSNQFKSCTSPKTYKNLKKGKYTFQVRAVGPGGNDPSPAKKSFKIKK